MVVTLDDAKRMAIAQQLAEMKAVQNLLISINQMLINAVSDESIRQRLEEMLKQDQKNLGILETAMIQYGISAELKETAQQKLEGVQGLVARSEISLSEKVFQLELLKHQQTMSGLIIHKAAQVAGADIEVAIAPLHTINFENRTHQEQLKGILEILSVRDLSGQEADQGLWARVEDSIAALTGVVGSVVTRSDDEMSIQNLLLMDHSKADILFAEILGSDDPEKIQEYFGQLCRDVSVHGLAEEEVLYPAAQPYYDQMEEIVDQTDHVMQMLDRVKSIDPADPNFKVQIQQVKIATREHIGQEEQDIFPKLRDNFTHEQQKQLATDFKAAKSRLQAQKTLPIPQRQINLSINQSHAMNNSIPWKLVFQSKAIINWVEAVIFLVADRQIRELLQTEPLVNVAYSQLVYGLVFIIGIGYWWVGQDIAQNQGIIKLGILAQFSVFFILAYHTSIGSLHPFFLISGILDLIYAILFSWFLYSVAQRQRALE